MTLTVTPELTQPHVVLSPDRRELLIRHIHAPHHKKSHGHTSPIDLEEVGRVPWGTDKCVVEAAAKVRKAQNTWATTPLKQRVAVMKKLHDRVLEQRDLICDIIQTETGKSRQSALEEVADVAMTARYYSRNAKRHLGPHTRAGAFPLVTTTIERNVPKGLVGMITPWNYPFTLPVSDAIPALLAGNGVLLKPDPKTPFSALIGLDLLRQAGLPEDLFLVVTGEPAEVGSALIAQSDFVMFTGSTQTGRIIAQACGHHLVDFSAELGGKNPMIVLEDAPLSRAVEGTIAASFSNAGQLCMSIERLMVHEKVAPQFIEMLVKRVSELRLGVGLDWKADVGSLISESQLTRVKAHVADAVELGAEVLVGGKHRPELGPYVFEPTLLRGVTEDMIACREETFGPVVSITTFGSDEEAIERANDTDYGLNASVWGAPRHARKVAERIEAGSVNINEGFTATWASLDAPMGGFKKSGVGRRHGRAGIVKYTDAQAIARQRLVNISRPASMDGEKFAKLMVSGLKLLAKMPGRH
jgi:succinate-semialdehyde dehydrogenase / glutarate-semialdehyde dehydrogenase